MKTITQVRQLGAFVSRPQILIAGWLVVAATEVLARAPNAVPEPSLLSLLGAGVVAGIIAYRIKNKK